MFYWLFSIALLATGIVLLIRRRTGASSAERLLGFACSAAGVAIFGYALSGPLAAFLERGL